KRMMNTLLQTPLSLTQRGVISEIAKALDRWQRGKADGRCGAEFQVESPDLARAQFDVAEVITCAFEVVHKNADEAGVTVQTSMNGPIPENLHGCPQQIHQLIALLASSVPRLARAERLDVQ